MLKIIEETELTIDPTRLRTFTRLSRSWRSVAQVGSDSMPRATATLWIAASSDS